MTLFSALFHPHMHFSIVQFLLAHSLIQHHQVALRQVTSCSQLGHATSSSIGQVWKVESHREAKLGRAVELCFCHSAYLWDSVSLWLFVSLWLSICIFCLSICIFVAVRLVCVSIWTSTCACCLVCVHVYVSARVTVCLVLIGCLVRLLG
jgi:hypothetical protein